MSVSPLGLALVFIGGGIGSCLRWLASFLAPSASTFPWATLAVNAAGSAVMGGVMAWIISSSPDPHWRLFLAVGVLGGFTTFSSFSYEGLALLQKGAVAAWAAYSLGSVALGLAFCWAGFEGVKLFLGPGSSVG